MGIVTLSVKLLRQKPEKWYKWEPIKDDLEEGNLAYPVVLVQIPMCNEKEVYQLSIGAACCGLSRPRDRIIIQVLDDSTDPAIKVEVQHECWRWTSKGVNVKYERRDNRIGYKAGSLRGRMKHSYVKLCDLLLSLMLIFNLTLISCDTPYHFLYTTRKLPRSGPMEIWLVS
ncbi:glucomannan 4-beta-mannosyltransferase 9-like [Olea europaea subsp. europaea]|nr:glucomannan 4-beta-mannosyltransferase 9-like [Olea europaea subsp. europaea]